MTLLADAFMARDILHDCLDITLGAAVIFHDPKIVPGDHLVVRIPLRPTPHGCSTGASPDLTLVLFEKGTGFDTYTYAVASISPGASTDNRTFRLTPTNLAAYLGLEAIPLFHRPNPADLQATDASTWLADQTRQLINFGWYDTDTNVSLSVPLVTNPSGQPDARYKVYKDGRNDTWTTKLINLDGRPRDLTQDPPQSTHRFKAIRAVEDIATRLRHWPKPATPAVLLWKTVWTPKATVHQCILNNARFIECYADYDNDLFGYSVTLREQDHSEHGGTQFFDSLPEALDHTLTLVHRSIKANHRF